jgi:hypothetical protein
MTLEDDMDKTSDDRIASQGKVNTPRFTVVESADRVDSSSGYYIGQMCHNHVLAEVYVQLDETGQLVAMHTLDVGSC